MRHLDIRLRQARHAVEAGFGDSAVHRLDPRAKALVTLFFIIAATSFPPHDLGGPAPLFLYPCAAAALADIPLRPLFGRALLLSPLALVAGIANPLLDRAPVLLMPNVEIAAGWLSLGSIFEKFVLCASAALLLARTTRIDDLCAGLAALRVPRAFAVQLLLLGRYLFVLGEEALRMTRAAAARTGGKKLSLSFVGPFLGSLLLRTVARAGRIELAMRARGFAGELLPSRPLEWGTRETLFVAGWCAFFVVARAGALSLSFGKALGL